MKKAEAYWLSTDGNIYEVSMRHTNFIRENLELFGLTEADYTGAYKKHHEHPGFEGKARREMMTELIRKGWCRIRHKTNKGWTIELWSLDKQTIENVFNWTDQAKPILAGTEIFLNLTDIHIYVLEHEAATDKAFCINTSFEAINQNEFLR